MLWQAILINAVVLTVVLESDLGRQRKITKFRLLRPLVTSLIIIPFFIKGAAGSGTGLLLEVLLTVAGLAIALLAMWQMKVYLSPQTGKPVTRAGLAYALVWASVMAARTVFTYGSSHWFAAPLGRWLTREHVTADALTDALIFMALVMVLTRVAVMAIRSRSVRAQAVTGPAGAVGVAAGAAGAGAAPVTLLTPDAAGPGHWQPADPSAPDPSPANPSAPDPIAPDPSAAEPSPAAGFGRAAAGAAGTLASALLDRRADRERRRAGRRGRRDLR